MQILSYRGPSAAGGVSNTLMQMFELQNPTSVWWFVQGNRFQSKKKSMHDFGFGLDPSLVTNHYRYCNNFLWPVLHDLPQYAVFSEEERQSYNDFNMVVSQHLKYKCRARFEDCFVNDYQFAKMPTLLSSHKKSFVFWHIPWPKRVIPEHAEALVEIALGLLDAEVIGFHTSEYLKNFFSFVACHLPSYFLNEIETTIVAPNSHQTKFVVAPLGIDSERWSELSRLGAADELMLEQDDLKIILSVDRVDYTKGIRERFEAIDCFFKLYPEWQKRITFIQLGTRSRAGLPEFDRYWQECHDKYLALNKVWSSKSWTPIMWIEEPRTAKQLATLYRKTEVMIVSPLRDGLNLTAKEFVASQIDDSAVLALSEQAGVWTEIGEDCVRIDPNNPVAFAHSIAACLEMEQLEKSQRLRRMKNRISKNSLSTWSRQFQTVCNNSKLASTTRELIAI